MGSTVFGIKNIYGNIDDYKTAKDVVSIVRVRDGNIQRAVEEAIDLLGGIKAVTSGKNRILLKPNLVAPDKTCTTKSVVVGTIANLMQNAGKEVMIGEGSAAAESFNVIGNDTFRTRKREILDGMQKYVFDTLGYTEMANTLKIPLINLHSGNIIEVQLNKRVRSQFSEDSQSSDGR